MIICDEMGSDLLKTEVFTSGFYKHLIAFIDPRYYKNCGLLGEVLWILINLACVEDEEKLKLLFREKLVSRLISLIKSDESSDLIDDVYTNKAQGSGEFINNLLDIMVPF